jgi:AraC-like DNA-binding protein
MQQRWLKRSAKDATVRIGPVLAVPAVLESLGADPAAVLAEAGLDAKLFDDPDNLIGYAARGRLLGCCVASTGCRHFGLLLGQQGGLDAFGLVGLLVKYSPDVGSALRGLVRYMHLHVRGAVVGLAVTGDRAVLSYDIYQPHVEATDQLGDAALAMMLNVMRTLCGPVWMPVEARFAHRKPEDVRPFRRLFRVPLTFDAGHYALVFDVDWLSHSLPAADAGLRRLLQKQIDALESRHADELPEQVRSVLRTALMTGHGKADQVAALFSINRRTLHRRLNAYGTCFQELADEIGFEIARQFLETSAMDVHQIAAALDYADATAFTRAFRRWSGSTPARWREGFRAAHRRGEPAPISRSR